MTTEEKFNAAVNVIKGLPKNGSYQPSHDLMLRFYAFYKQATLGPCKCARPAFWDIVGRAKYDAWKNLGDMPKSDAMSRYVNELHSCLPVLAIPVLLLVIVETMSYSDKVANFLNAPTTEMNNVNLADLELVAGDVIEQVRSRSNSPLVSRDQSPQRMTDGRSGGESESSYPSATDSDHSDGEYVDTIEPPEQKKIIPNGKSHTIPLTNGYVVNKEHKSRKHKTSQSVDISHEISMAVQSLKSDMEALTKKVNAMELSADVRVVVPKRAKRWQEISSELLVFMFVWPVVTSFIVNTIMNRRKT